jgi:hypothetical protein
MASQETLYNVFWEGPFSWNERTRAAKKHHCLYQIYGQHAVYGSNVLLYIGMAENVSQRLEQHEEWIADECDEVTIRVGSLGLFTGWSEWEKAYPKVDRAIVDRIEALLIYAHQPAFNSANKATAKEKSRGLRIFNSGKCGQLLPEVSYKYYFGDD